MIVAIASRPIYGQDTLLATIADLRVGQQVAITVVRQDASGGTVRVTLRAVLKEAPANPQG